MQGRKVRGGLGCASLRSFVFLALLISLIVLLSLPSGQSRRTSRVVSRYRPISTSRYRPISTSRYRPIITSRYKPITTSRYRPITTSRYRPIVRVTPKPISRTYIQPVFKIRPRPVISSPIYSYRPTYSYNPLPIRQTPIIKTVPRPSVVYQPYQPYKPYQPYRPVTQQCKRSKAGREYKGYHTKSRSGRYCHSWLYSSHSYTNNMFSDGSISQAGRKCRNPDPLFPGGPWCYISDPKVRWEICDVPMCQGSSNSPLAQNSTNSSEAQDRFKICQQKNCPYGSKCEYIGRQSPTEVRCSCPTQTCPSSASPVCASNGVTYDSECHLMKAQCNSVGNIVILHQGKCYEMCKDDETGRGYMGNLTMTRGGRTCQSWSSSYPNPQLSSSVNAFRDGSATLARSRCRNPDPANKKYGPWCYTSRNTDWDYCDVPSCSGCQKLDIVLAIHQSSRFTLVYWNNLINELKAFVAAFRVSSENVRIGCVTFGRQVTVNFHLNQLDTVDKVQAALGKILYSPAGANVSGTLGTVKNQMFVPEKGDRSGVQNMVVMILGERETLDTWKTSYYVKALQDSETLLFGVGLGYYIDSYSLRTLSSYSSDKKNKLAYYNSDLNKMHQTMNDVAINVCRNSAENDAECTRTTGGWHYVGSVSRTKSGHSCRSWASEISEEKHKYTDSMFPEGSRLVSGEKCRNPDRNFAGGPWCFTNNRFVPWELCDVKRCSEKFQPAVKKNVIKVGSSVLDLGFLGLSGGSDVSDPCKTKQCPYGSRCQRLMKEGPTATECVCPTQDCPKSVHEPVCGSDGVTYDNECQLMKAQCSTRSALSAADRLVVINRGKCRCDKADVVFLLDSSGSISTTMWTRILQFVKDVVKTFNVGSSNVRVGILEFSDNAYINFHLGTYSTKQEVLTRIDSIRKFGRMTNTADAFYKTRTEMFTARNGDRPDVPNIAILITDGASTVKTGYTLRYAEDVKRAGITIISVGVQYSSSMYTNELSRVASEVNGVKQLFHISNIYSMGNLHKTINMAVCSQASDPCLSRKCLYGAWCKSEPYPDAKSPLDTQARCVCPVPMCSYLINPVCGDDGISYDNDCYLMSARCKKQKMISIARRGKCIDPCSTVRCGYGAECKVVNGTTSCVCPEICPMNFDPLCGSDGQTYNNLCQMNAASCKKKIGITIKNKGACDPCSTVRCGNGAECKVVNGTTSCVCPEICPMNFDPLCGSDGETYSNLCQMNAASCRRKIGITIKNKGACVVADPCSTVNCTYGAKCTVANGIASCVCPTVCTKELHLLCGSDGQSYSNECYMKKASCEKKIEISVKSQGMCPQPTLVENKSKRTEFFCKSTTSGTEFRGNVTKTINGKTCQAWTQQRPNQHNYTQSSMFSDGSVSVAGNQCRNPDPGSRKAGPWCFTTDSTQPWEYCDVPSCSGCELVDIVFVLDSSVSISRQYWPRALKFVKDLIKNFHYGETATRFGVVTYGYRSTIEFHLNQFNNKEAVLNAVDQITYKAESTNTSGALWTMREKMFVSEKGDRQGAPNIGILVTDGGSNMDEEKTIPYANDAKKSGITMFAVGVGSFIDEQELRGVASKVNGREEVYYVSDYDSLLTIRDEISRAICTGAAARPK